MKNRAGEFSFKPFFKTAGASILLIASNAATATSFTFFDLGTSGIYSYARAINNAGQIVGLGIAKEALWDGATVTGVINFPGLSDSGYNGSPEAINERGQVVGRANFDNCCPVQAVLWDGPNATFIASSKFSSANGINDAGQILINSYLSASIIASGRRYYLDDRFTSGSGINNLGQVAGTGWNTGAGSSHAFFGDVHSMEDLGTLGGRTSGALALNDVQQVVGYSTITGSENNHAFLWNSGIMVDLGTLLGFKHSIASAINNMGEVVGWSSINNDYPYHTDRATLWKGTTAFDLNSYLSNDIVSNGWVLERAYAINDLGMIVGSAYNTQGGITHGFLLAPDLSIPDAAPAEIPIPAPSTYTLLLAGLFGMLYATSRTKHLG